MFYITLYSFFFHLRTHIVLIPWEIVIVADLLHRALAPIANHSTSVHQRRVSRMHHLVVHWHCVGSSLAKVVFISIEVAIGRVTAKVLVASMDGWDMLGTRSYYLLHSKLVVEVLYILQGLLVVLLRVLIINDTCSIDNSLLVFFVWARFILR